MSNALIVMLARRVRSRFQGALRKGSVISGTRELDDFQRGSKLVARDGTSIIKMRGTNRGLKVKRRRASRGSQGSVESFFELIDFLTKKVSILGSEASIELGEDIRDAHEKFELAVRFRGEDEFEAPVTLWENGQGTALVFNKERIFGDKDQSTARRFRLLQTRSGQAFSNPREIGGMTFFDVNTPELEEELVAVFNDDLNTIWWDIKRLAHDMDDDRLRAFLIRQIEGMGGISDPRAAAKSILSVVAPSDNDRPALFNRWGTTDDQNKILDFSGGEQIEEAFRITSGDLIGWSKVIFSSTTGFMESRFLTGSIPTPSLEIETELENKFSSLLNRLRLEMMWYVQEFAEDANEPESTDDVDTDIVVEEDLDEIDNTVIPEEENSEILDNWMNLEEWVKGFMTQQVNRLGIDSEPTSDAGSFFRVVSSSGFGTPSLFNQWGAIDEENKIRDFSGGELVREEFRISSGDLAGWSKVVFNSEIGFIQSTFLQAAQDTAST